MEIAILGFYFVSLLGCFWGLVRTLTYKFGKHSDYIHVSSMMSVYPILGIWLSWTSLSNFVAVETASMQYGIETSHNLSIFGWFVVFGLIGFLKVSLIDSKTSKSLMEKREELLKSLEPNIIIDATDQLILDENLMADEWVSNTWNKLNKSEWEARLSSNPSLFKDTVQKKIQIQAKDFELYANWINLIQHFCYLEKKGSDNWQEELSESTMADSKAEGNETRVETETETEVEDLNLQNKSEQTFQAGSVNSLIESFTSIGCSVAEKDGAWGIKDSFGRHFIVDTLEELKKEEELLRRVFLATSTVRSHGYEVLQPFSNEWTIRESSEYLRDISSVQQLEEFAQSLT